MCHQLMDGSSTLHAPMGAISNVWQTLTRYVEGVLGDEGDGGLGRLARAGSVDGEDPELVALSSQKVADVQLSLRHWVLGDLRPVSRLSFTPFHNVASHWRTVVGFRRLPRQLTR